MRKALVINDKDNVATALQELKEDEEINVNIKGKIKKIKLRQKIPLGHKIALQRIEKGKNVVKYGEVIGRAVEGIQEGEYVHIHNIESLRGRGDIGQDFKILKSELTARFYRRSQETPS